MGEDDDGDGDGPVQSSSAPLPATKAAPALAPTPAPAAVTTVLTTAVEAFYGRGLPFECDLASSYFIRAGSVMRNASMRLTFVRPGEFHLRYTTGETVIVSQQRMIVFNPNTQQSFTQTVTANFCPMAFAYAGGVGTLASHLSLVSYPGTLMNAPGLELLVGTPRGSPTVSKALYYVDPNTGEVHRSVILTSAGDRQRFDIVTCTMNIPPPPPSLFTTPPTSRQPPAPITPLPLPI